MHYMSDDLVKKGSGLISAIPQKEGILQPIDFALFSYLLKRVYHEIIPNVALKHQVSMHDVLSHLKLPHNAEGIYKLKASVRRLVETVISLDYTDPSSGEVRTVMSRYLSVDISSVASGILYFAFDAILSQFLLSPKIFAMISVNRIRDLDTVASQRLYEIMTLQFRKQSPSWNISPEDLRKILLVPEDKHTRFDNLKQFVIDKAVADVNLIADFDIAVDYRKGGKGGKVVEVSFTTHPKSHAGLLEASAVKSPNAKKVRNLDKDTIDIFDGQTRNERGGPASLSSEAIEKVRSLMNEDHDLNHIVEEWRRLNRGRAMNSPDELFINWFKMKLEAENEEILQDVDDDIFGTLLHGKS